MPSLYIAESLGQHELRAVGFMLSGQNTEKKHARFKHYRHFHNIEIYKYNKETRRNTEKKTQQRLTNHFSTNPLTDATSCKKCIHWTTEQLKQGGIRSS